MLSKHGSDRSGSNRTGKNLVLNNFVLNSIMVVEVETPTRLVIPVVVAVYPFPIASSTILKIELGALELGRDIY